MTHFIALALALTTLASCAGDVLVAFPAHEPAPNSPLQEVPSTEFALAARVAADAAIGGQRSTAGEVNMGAVAFEVDPLHTVAEAFVSELESAGHVFALDDTTHRIEVVLETFAARTDVSPLYWDVTFDAVVAVEPTGSRYVATSTDRTYLNPGRSMITQLARDCLAQLATQFREDPRIAAFLAEGDLRQ